MSMNSDWQTKFTQKHERYFFDLPVFSCKKEKWNQGQENKKLKFAQNTAGVGKKITKQNIAFANQWLQLKLSAYRYGEMVGMIRLYAMNQQIRGELFFVSQKRLINLKNKRWKYFGKLFEFTTFNMDTNKTIFEKILKRLQEENKKDLLKNKFVDFEAFYNSGNYINYIELTNNKRN